MNRKEEVKEKIDTGLNVYTNVKEWINNADLKISILAAFMAIILGYIIVDSNSNVIDKIINVINNGYISKIHVIKGILVLALYSTTLLSIIKLLEALKAKINIKEYKDKKITTNSLMFYGSISNLDYSEYINKVKNQSEESKMNDIYSQIYINSKICNKKFKCYNLGLDLGKISIVLLCICKVFAII